MITIIDFKMGNLGSIANMLKKIGYPSRISDKLNEIEDADKIILPGVGHFDKAMNNLNGLGFRDVLNRKALEEKVPILGICLGMQLLAEKSEEGKLPGLGWIRGKVKKFSFNFHNKHLKVPHMGWNIVYQQKINPLFKDMYPDPRFYFVHSYYMKCDHAGDVDATCDYGGPVTAAIRKKNIFATQFHPEKSQCHGLRILKNFLKWSPDHA